MMPPPAPPSPRPPTRAEAEAKWRERDRRAALSRALEEWASSDPRDREVAAFERWRAVVEDGSH